MPGGGSILNVRVLALFAILSAATFATLATAPPQAEATPFWAVQEPVSLSAGSVDCASVPTVEAAVDPLGLFDGRIPVTCPGIRPGAQMVEPSGCTLAWILRDNMSNLYAATAGHCVNAEGAQVHLAVDNVPAGIASPDETVYLGDAWYVTNAGEGFDIAFIRIRDEVKADVNPQLCHWGGPTGLYTGGGALGDVVRQYGHGIGIGWTPETRARSGLAAYWTDVGFGYYGVVTNGDSGSPAMLADGRAIGVVDTLGTHFSFGLPGGTVAHAGGAGTLLAQGIALAKAAKGVELELVTAPLITA